MTTTALTAQIMGVVDAGAQVVFLRADFKDLAPYHVVGRALAALVRGGQLTRIGRGFYVPIRPSAFSGQPGLTQSLKSLGVAALTRVGIPTGPTAAEDAYNSGRSTQVPAGRKIGVKKPTSRKIGHGGHFLSFELIAQGDTGDAVPN